MSLALKQISSVENTQNNKFVENTHIDPLEIDVGDVAKKAFCSLALIFTNSILTVSVGAMKLTGFTIITSLVLGWITKPLHSLNTSLATHAYAPFQQWAEALSNENIRIIHTDKVLGIVNKRLKFYPQNYINHAHDSFKAAVAPISVALSITNAVLWLAVKPLWVVFLLPGLLGDCIVTLPLGLNKGIGYLTYAPLQEISDKMFDFHWNTWLPNVTPPHGF